MNKPTGPLFQTKVPLSEVYIKLKIIGVYFIKSMKEEFFD